jgi:glycosyltransferase involved in cell wall biosynthesis
MRILVVTRSYPSTDDLYQYPFVHRRVLAYASAGHEVTVFRPARQPRLSSHSFEGVTCLSGDREALRQVAEQASPHAIAAHGFSEEMWEALAPISSAAPIRAWLHGSEIPGFLRRKAMSMTEDEGRSSALAALDRLNEFWRRFLPDRPDRFKLVFVSRSAVELAREDWGEGLREGDYAVAPNPIDTDLFTYHRKTAEDRLRILMVRPFDARTYGNDLAVAAIIQLAGRSGFERLQFSIFGDRHLFDETVAPLRGLPNVRLERRFLTQREIAEQHRLHGLFLVPTRLDTHGVSRDEAMASGLVPVTNRVSAVPEFVDESCAALAGPDDAAGLAEAIWEMVESPELFLARSAAAAERVRSRTSHHLIIPAELELLAETVDA